MMFENAGGLWAIATVVGPILLGAILLWAIFHNRTTKAQERRTEEATKKLYDEQNKTDQRTEGD
ncbi:hypothetical protein [Sphingomonas koreensis]|jgi:hypothetical protein|uniref:hypothetical protein n=1 Tax=Sphingomonas koreensis TaxID=93064 RepID=UPI000F7DCDFB|nr:hypothetical protein [Sphingomonas koreensis]MDC7808742.1 hypothetical protein [Sphingomonas koreensis]RSU98885.1 hypothetical protein CA256_02845 [Sphingomonas koreensis]